MSEQILVPIELTDDELAAVSGGRTTVVVGIAQKNSQYASLAQIGGDLSIGGGGSTAVSGNVSFTETFTASITQVATNVNNGSVTATVAASS